MDARERFEELVGEALDGLPPWVRERLDNVEVLIEDSPTSSSNRSRASTSSASPTIAYESWTGTESLRPEGSLMSRW